jgi:prepilin-type processing-associated H-X9-DG protein
LKPVLTMSHAHSAPDAFQFTLVELLLAMSWAAIALALGVQLGVAGFWLWLAPTSVAVTYWANRRKKERWFIVGVFGIVLAGFLFVLQGMGGLPRTPSRRAICNNNLRSIALALQQYEATFGCFPPPYIADASGKPMHSWRVLILPYLDLGSLHKQYNFNEPWDGPNNRKLHDAVLPIYSCPSRSKNQSATDTSYVVIVGNETMWPGTKRISLTTIAAGDGASKTIMLAEVHDSGIHWMEPRDLHLTQMAPTINAPSGQGISSGHTGGANVAFADGHTQFLPSTMPAETLRALLTINGKETIQE